MAALSDTPTPQVLTPSTATSSAAADATVSDRTVGALPIENGSEPAPTSWVGAGHKYDDDDDGDGDDAHYRPTTNKRSDMPVAKTTTFGTENSTTPTSTGVNSSDTVVTPYFRKAAIKGKAAVIGREYCVNNYSAESSYSNPSKENGRTNSFCNPKIRLTPTTKLMATPNAVDPKRKYVCPYDNCTKSYGKSSHLRSHLTWHTGIKPFVCQEPNCGKGFTRSDELNRHVRTHTGEKPFECIQCTKKFSRSDHLTKHLATHAKQMQNNCPKRVKAESSRQVSFAKPVTPVAVMAAAPIDDMFAAIQRSAGHIDFNDGMHFMAALVHDAQQRMNTPENLTDEPKPHQARPIKIKLEKPEHSNEYHVVPPQTNATTPAPYDRQGPEFLLPLATSAPASPSASVPTLKVDPNDRHVKEEMNDDDAIMPEANAPPPLAGSAPSFAQFGHFIAELAYDPTKPFRCQLCVKCFKRQDDLNRHMRTHTGEKPFACTECDRRFMRSDHLKKHLNTHIKLR